MLNKTGKGTVGKWVARSMIAGSALGAAGAVESDHKPPPPLERESQRVEAATGDGGFTREDVAFVVALLVGAGVVSAAARRSQDEQDRAEERFEAWQRKRYPEVYEMLDEESRRLLPFPSGERNANSGSVREGVAGKTR